MRGKYTRCLPAAKDEEQSDNSCEIPYKTKGLDSFFLFFAQILYKYVNIAKDKNKNRAVPRTARLNQSILKEINHEYSLGGADAEAKVPILWPSDMKSLLKGKDSRCLERLKAGEGGDRG